MATPLQRLRELPLATLAGVVTGGLTALIGAALSFGPLEDTAHPLAVFALAPAPALLGLWLDWARLYGASKRTRLWSFAAIACAGLIALDASIWTLSSPDIALVAPVFMGFVVAAFGILLTPVLGRGLAPLFGWRAVRGVVRRDETERLILDTGSSAIELDRRVEGLGARRELSLAIGTPVTVLARLQQTVAEGDAYRQERRSSAHAILAVGADVDDLFLGLRRRARAWALYLGALGLASALVVAMVGYRSVEDDVTPAQAERGAVDSASWASL